MLTAGVAMAALLIPAPVAASAEQATEATIPVPLSTCKKPGELGSWFSPSGRADIRLAPEFLSVINSLNPEFTASEPVTIARDLSLISMPVGFMHDNFGSGGEIFYPGGFSAKEPKSGHTLEVNCFWLKVFPSALYTAPIVDGVKLPVIKIATFNLPDVIKGVRPELTGFTVKNWPFYLSQETAELFNKVLGTNLKQGMLLGWLEPHLNFADAKPFIQAFSSLTGGAGTALPGLSSLTGLAGGLGGTLPSAPGAYRAENQ
jgi:hypothetical protein